MAEPSKRLIEAFVSMAEILAGEGHWQSPETALTFLMLKSQEEMARRRNAAESPEAARERLSRQLLRDGESAAFEAWLARVESEL